MVTLDFRIGFTILGVVIGVVRNYFRTNVRCSLYVILINAPHLFVFISDYLFKLLLIGDSGVGKSCLLLRFAVSGHPYGMHCHV